MLSTILILLTILAGLQEVSTVIVKLPVGSLRGSQWTSKTGKTFYKYEGIPYAEPPVGHLRFQAPVEKKPWNSLLDATQHKNRICYQVYRDSDSENEDCLFLNIYSPVSPTSNRTVPVLVWIYGGGFNSGSVYYLQSGAADLIAKDVMVIEFNYRVGPFGFLSTGDRVIPGNAGLKDQRLALKWTQKYIRYFGGDPKRVTLFGASAGSVSVAYHVLSPGSRGLFRAAICQSGSALTPFGYNRNMTRMTYDMTKAIDPQSFSQHSATSWALLNYLQNLPAKKIDQASSKLWYPHYVQIQHGFFYAPVIEVEHEGAVITRKQYELLKNGQINNVPIMMGFASEESITMLQDQNVHDFESNHQTLIPLDMNEKPKLRNEIAAIIYTRYAKKQTFIQNKRNAVKYMTDQCFARSIKKHAQLQSRYGNVWFYRFAYKGPMGGVANKPVPGYSPDVGHGEDQNYIFNPKDSSLYPYSDVLVHNRMVTMWANFVKYLNPTPNRDQLLLNITWPKFTPSEEVYLDIGSEMRLANNPKKDDLDFWDHMYAKYGRPPYDTY